MTVTATLVAFAGNAMDDGTLAIVALSELRVMVRPAGAGADRLSVSVPVPPAPRVRVLGETLNVAVTCTVCESPSNPGAEALMVAEPNFSPVTCGCAEGAVCPWGINTVC